MVLRSIANVCQTDHHRSLGLESLTAAPTSEASNDPAGHGRSSAWRAAVGVLGSNHISRAELWFLIPREIDGRVAHERQGRIIVVEDVNGLIRGEAAAPGGGGDEEVQARGGGTRHVEVVGVVPMVHVEVLAHEIGHLMPADPHWLHRYVQSSHEGVHESRAAVAARGPVLDSIGGVVGVNGAVDDLGEGRISPVLPDRLIVPEFVRPEKMPEVMSHPVQHGNNAVQPGGTDDSGIPEPQVGPARVREVGAGTVVGAQGGEARLIIGADCELVPVLQVPAHGGAVQDPPKLVRSIGRHAPGQLVGGFQHQREAHIGHVEVPHVGGINPKVCARGIARHARVVVQGLVVGGGTARGHGDRGTPRRVPGGRVLVGGHKVRLLTGAPMTPGDLVGGGGGLIDIAGFGLELPEDGGSDVGVGRKPGGKVVQKGGHGRHAGGGVAVSVAHHDGIDFPIVRGLEGGCHIGDVVGPSYAVAVAVPLVGQGVVYKSVCKSGDGGLK